jgi:hypothetical protein
MRTNSHILSFIQSRFLVRSRNLLIYICLSLYGSLTFATANSGITYHGRILNPDGSPVTNSAVQFKMQIATPDGQTCLMYQEIQTKDLSATNGAFSITLNDGSGTATLYGYNMDQIFGNYGTFSFSASNCLSGTGSYTPNASDGRAFIVSFKTSTMSSYEALPTQLINFAPFAIEAKQVAGFPGNSLMRVDSGSGPTAIRAITSTEANALLDLADGISTKYVQSTGNGAPLPSFSSNPSSPTAGDVWYDSTSKIIKYYDGTSVQVVGSGSGSGTVTSITAGTGLSGGTITTTGTISMPNTGTAGTYTKVTTDAQGRVTAGAQITGADITSGTIGGSTAINSTGNITTTGNITGANVSSTTDSTNNLKIFESTNTNAVTVKAPAALVSGGYTLTLPTDKASSAGQVLASDTSGNLSWASAATGSVTSVGMTVPSFLSVTGSPITTAGTLAVSLANENANLVFAGPSSGGAAAPTFRSLASADIPNLDWSKITTGTPSTLSGYGITDAVKNAGNSPSLQQGIDASLPAAGTAGRIYIATDTKKIYRDNGTSWDVISSAAGAGGTVTNVTGTAPVSVATGTSTPVISMHVADASHDGYLSSTDWSTFNSKLSSLPTNVYVNGGNSFGGAATLGTTDSNTLALETNGTTALTIDTSQKIGIGVTTPSAFLQLKAGTATAGTAPLKFTAGTLTTTAEAGAVEYDGSSLYYTDSGGTRHALAASGSGITALTGDVSATGSGSVAATVNKVNGVAYSSGPSTNTVPVVTAANTVTYEAVPNAALANSSVTLGSTSVSLGATASSLAGLTSVGLGVAGTTAGTLTIANTNASGTVTIQNPSATAAYNFNLPATAGTSGQALLSGGGGASAMTWGSVGVGGGGTGLTSGASGGIPYFASNTTMASSALLTSHAVVLGGGSGAAPYSISALGSTGNVLMSNGSSADPTFGALNLAGGSAYVTNQLPVANGGTGAATLTAHGVLLGEGTSAVSATSAGGAGTVLTGQGSSADPSFSATPTLGVNGVSGTTGKLALANGVASGASTTIQPSASTTAAWTLTLPSSGGTNLYFLQTDGNGNTSWALPTATLPTLADDKIWVGQSGTATAVTMSGDATMTNAGVVSVASTGASGFYKNGGNSFGAAATLGTNDANTLGLETNGSTRMTIDTSGNVGLGTTSPSSMLELDKVGSGSTAPVISINGYTNGTASSGAYLLLNTSRGATVGSLVAAQSGDTSGSVDYSAVNTTPAFSYTARIMSAVDGAPGASNVPGRLMFYTTNGTSGSAERMRIDSSGNVGVGTTSPTATLHLKAGTATAGTAPLKLTAGTLTTTAEAGAVEYDGSSLYYTDSGGARHALAASGSGITALTGDVSATGSGSVAATVNKVNGVAYSSGPSTNTVPVVTAANTVTYEAVPNSALANSSLTLGSTSVSLGATAASITGLTSIGVGSSNTATIQNPSASAAYNFNLPTSAGSSGQVLISAGGGASPMTWGSLSVGGGGTGLTSGNSGGIPYFSSGTTMASSAALTNHGLVVGGGSGAAPYTVAVGGAGTILTGTGGDPGFSATPTLGVNGTSGTTGQIALANGATSGQSTTIAPSASTTSAWTMTLPSSGGTNGYVLQTNGSGTTSWVNPASTITAAVAPSFLVNRNAVNQTVTTGSWTKIQFNNKVYDTIGAFDATTNYRYTPTVAGKYIFTVTAYCSDSTVCYAGITKNGSFQAQSTGNYYYGTVNVILDMNGTTDYVEADVLNLNGTTLGGASDLPIFSGALLAPLASGSVAGTGTANYMPMWSSSTTLANSPVAVSGSNVGIGTSTPQAVLHLMASTAAIKIQDSDTANGGNVAAYAEFRDSAGAQMGYVGFGGANIYDIWGSTSAPMRFGVNGAEKMRIDTAGNVGIGTATPSSLLNLQSAGYPTLTMTKAGIGSWQMGNTTANNLDFWFNASSPALSITNDNLVGIGTTSPSNKLQVSSGDSSIALFGPNATWNSYLAIGAGNVQAGSGKAQVISTNGNLHLDAGTGQSIYLGYFTATNTLINVNGGNVGIGTAGPSYTLHVNGSVAGTSAYNNLSDIRLKKNIETIPNALEKISDLRGVSFEWRKEDYPNLNLGEKQEVGVIAQEVEKVFPQAVSEDKYTGIKSVAYSMLIGPIINAIKELHKIVEEQRQLWTADHADIEKLITDSAHLRTKIDAQQQQIDQLVKQNQVLLEHLNKLENARQPAAAQSK